MSQDSSDSREREPIFIQASDIRRRLTDSLNAPTKSFQRDPEDPSAAALKVLTLTLSALPCREISFDFTSVGAVGRKGSANSWIISLWPSLQLETTARHRQVWRWFATRAIGLSNPFTTTSNLGNGTSSSLAKTLSVNSDSIKFK